MPIDQSKNGGSRMRSTAPTLTNGFQFPSFFDGGGPSAAQNQHFPSIGPCTEAKAVAATSASSPRNHRTTMDLSLELADTYLFDTLYPAHMARDDLLRQSLSVSGITLVGGVLIYLSGAGASYALFFDKQLMKHPRFLKDQVRKEIMYSLQSIPVMTLLMLPWFLAEVRGYSMMYKRVDDYGWGYLTFSVGWFLFFTDMLIYWFHRWLHHPRVYAMVHKPHHKWIVPTPFASHAFHPVDGFIQALPYHLFVLIFPIHRVAFLVLFICVNYWTISIHDGLHMAKNSWLNGAAHHSVHHSDFVYNYGQYFTLWDRLAGSYREPPHGDGEKQPERKKEE